MRQSVEAALNAAEGVKDGIAKIREQYDKSAPEWEMADDALLGIGWAIKRLRDLESALPK